MLFSTESVQEREQAMESKAIVHIPDHSLLLKWSLNPSGVRACRVVGKHKVWKCFRCVKAAELCFHIKRVLAASWAELYKYLMQ